MKYDNASQWNFNIWRNLFLSGRVPGVANGHNKNLTVSEQETDISLVVRNASASD